MRLSHLFCLLTGLTLGTSLWAEKGQSGILSTENSRLLATGGATTLEGSAGGGIVPMAVLSGYGTREEHGGTLAASYVHTGDYELAVVAGSWSWANRVEVSYAEQRLQHRGLSERLGVKPTHIRQQVLGAKVRLTGDLIYTPWPQISAGLQYKKNQDFLIPKAAGALDDSDTDYYLSASKLILAGVAGHNLLLNATARYTRANQIGLVGFGGDLNDDREWMAEVSAGLLLNRYWMIGAEYRQKPDNLSFIKEDDWRTAFVGWFPTKHVSVVAAWVDLGEVATFDHQTGWYLSVQGSF